MSCKRWLLGSKLSLYHIAVGHDVDPYLPVTGRLSCPAVCMHQHLLRDLDERIVWHRNSTSGSSRIASSASLLYRVSEHMTHAVTPTRPRLADLILSDRLTPGNSTYLKPDLCSMSSPHLSARYRGQSSNNYCLASGLSSVGRRSPEPGCVAALSWLLSMKLHSPMICNGAYSLAHHGRESTRCIRCTSLWQTARCHQKWPTKNFHSMSRFN